MFITDLHGNRTLGLYTRRSLAEVACPEGFQIVDLLDYQVRNIIDDYGNRNLIDQVAFNPAQETTSAYRWPDFLETTEGGQNNVLQPIEEGEALENDYDDGLVAFQFPLYMFIRAEPQTPFEEIEVAVLQNARNIVPIFTKKEYAEAAKAVLKDDYRIEKFDKSKFIKVLRYVLLPRYLTS